jgi:hypothetical protein
MHPRKEKATKEMAELQKLWSAALNMVALGAVDLAADKYHMTIRQAQESEVRNEVTADAILRIAQDIGRLQRALEIFRKYPELVWQITDF